MKSIITVILSFCILSCYAQDTLTLEGVKYVGYSLNKTLNRSFMNKRHFFVKKQDTISVNQKLPLDLRKGIIYDYGVFFKCHLQKDTVYSISLKKIGLEHIPLIYNNYYRINAIFKNSSDRSKYIEIKKNTKVSYKGNYMKYFDLDNELYDMVRLAPGTGCRFDH